MYDPYQLLSIMQEVLPHNENVTESLVYLIGVKVRTTNRQLMPAGSQTTIKFKVYNSYCEIGITFEPGS